MSRSKKSVSSKKTGLTRQQQAQMVEAVLKNGSASIATIAERTGLSEKRIQHHLNYEMGELENFPLKAPRVERDKRGLFKLVGAEPSYRTEDWVAGAVANAKTNGGSGIKTRAARKPRAAKKS